MVIHKTMVMPTSCLSCWISPTCEVWVREKSKYKGYDNRFENCPLEPVKHGHWVYVGHGLAGESICKCSICGHQTPDDGNYCSYCGAKMDKDERQEPEINHLKEIMK